MAFSSDSRLSFDLALLSEALGISESDVLEYFTDGRRASFVCERRVAYGSLQGTVAASEGASYDILDKAGRKWEVRSLAKGGVYFCPSYMVGSGRTFEEGGFLEKLDDLAGYVICDITQFPEIPIWKIMAQDIREVWLRGGLGMNSRVSYKKFFQVFKDYLKPVE